MIRVCEHCGVELVRRAGEKPNKFLKRRYCGQEHFLAHRTSVAVRRETELGMRYCRGCGAVLRRKRYRGVFESIGAFEARQHCNPECMGVSRKGRPFPKARVVRFEPPPPLVGADTGVLLRAALRFHPELLRAFAEVEACVSVDSWEAYSQRTEKAA